MTIIRMGKRVIIGDKVKTKFIEAKQRYFIFMGHSFGAGWAQFYLDMINDGLLDVSVLSNEVGDPMTMEELKMMVDIGEQK